MLERREAAAQQKLAAAQQRLRKGYKTAGRDREVHGVEVSTTR